MITRNDRFSLVTADPGPDIAPIHGRQPVILRASDWERWLTEPAWPEDLAQPSPEGTVKALQVR